MELELPDKEEIYEDSIKVDDCKLILQDLLKLFNELKYVKGPKNNLVEEIYLKIFQLGITIEDHHKLIDINDNEIKDLSQQIANLFNECFSSFKYFAKYSLVCNWAEETTKIL